VVMKFDRSLTGEVGTTWSVGFLETCEFIENGQNSLLLTVPLLLAGDLRVDVTLVVTIRGCWRTDVVWNPESSLTVAFLVACLVVR